MTMGMVVTALDIFPFLAVLTEDKDEEVLVGVGWEEEEEEENVTVSWVLLLAGYRIYGIM